MYIEASVPHDRRSACNNLFSGIPHVLSGLDLYLLPMQYFPLLHVQCFPLLPVRSCDSDSRFQSPFPVPVLFSVSDSVSFHVSFPVSFPVSDSVLFPVPLPVLFPISDSVPFSVPFHILDSVQRSSILN